ncbi:hypothetical protein ACJX0J_031904 [Zea mays]
MTLSKAIRPSALQKAISKRYSIFQSVLSGSVLGTKGILALTSAILCVGLFTFSFPVLHVTTTLYYDAAQRLSDFLPRATIVQLFSQSPYYYRLLGLPTKGLLDYTIFNALLIYKLMVPSSYRLGITRKICLAYIFIVLFFAKSLETQILLLNKEMLLDFKVSIHHGVQGLNRGINLL